MQQIMMAQQQQQQQQQRQRMMMMQQQQFQSRQGGQSQAGSTFQMMPGMSMMGMGGVRAMPSGGGTSANSLPDFNTGSGGGVNPTGGSQEKKKGSSAAFGFVNDLM